MNSQGQSLLELVVGMGLIVVVVGAMAVVTINSLQNNQFAKNQVQATKMAQENLEKVHTIKRTNFGVCTKTNVDTGSNCSNWEDIWTISFGTIASGCITNATGCTFNLVNNCTVDTGGTPSTVVKPFCLRYSATRAVDPGGILTSQMIIEDEADSQKKVTSRVYWKDSSGEHSSDLATILTRI